MQHLKIVGAEIVVEKYVPTLVKAVECGCCSDGACQGACSDKHMDCGSSCGVSCGPGCTEGVRMQVNCGPSCTSSGNCSGSTNCQDSDVRMVQCSTCHDGGSGPDGGTGNCQDPEGPMVLGCAAISKSGLTQSQRQAIAAKIGEYPFDQVRYRLQHEGVLPPEVVETAIEEYVKYLTVIAFSSGPVGMISPIVDEVWHAFILHTQDYAQFCAEAFGWYLHHEPNTPFTPSAPEALPNFLVGYKALYGELNPIWNMRLS